MMRLLLLEGLYCRSWGLFLYMYGPQVVLLFTLVAITIFRREMSCNRCYAEIPIRRTVERRMESIKSSSSSSEEEEGDDDNSWEEDQQGSRDSLLEEAGCYGSGTYNLLLHSLLFPYAFLIDSFTLRIWQPLSSWWSVASEGVLRLEELLEGAERWSVQPPSPSVTMVKESSRRIRSAQDEEEMNVFPASQSLPNDVMVQILSFLHPKDVVSFASSSNTLKRAFYDTNCHALSNAVWKTLWLRDYGWIVQSWDIGEKALQRSLLLTNMSSLDDTVFTQTFYFRFGLCYVDYILAGHCTADRCLVGLGGHIYDITHFMDQHPGSPETVMVHSGRDASAMFETMRHTQRARRLAEQLCVVVDTSLLGHVGARPTSSLTRRSGCMDCFEGSIVVAPVAPSKCLSRTCHPFTLESMWERFQEEQELYQCRAARLESKIQASIVGHVHTFYDPFTEHWRAWYMSARFEAVFVDF
jgi:Cytochrome b5-like Heme/Steroid binding domain/F-box domain